MGSKGMKWFMRICKKNEQDLKKYLKKELIKYGYEPINNKGFLYAKGKLPVLLTAHMDTVHVKMCKNIHITKNQKKQIVLHSPEGIGGDDRCGIFMILKILSETDLRPSILFCEQEEEGGIGSRIFVKTKYLEDLKDLKFFIELDRANSNDAVFYDCGNVDFCNFILEETGYKEDFGSFSDISILSPASDIASVNLSCGYYKAHTLKEYVIWEEMLFSIKIVEKLLTKAANKDTPQFDFQEYIPYTWRDNGKYSFFDNYYNSYKYNSSYGNSFANSVPFVDDVTVEFHFYDDNKGYLTEYITGITYYDCLGQLFQKYPKLTYNDILDSLEY